MKNSNIFSTVIISTFTTILVGCGGGGGAAGSESGAQTPTNTATEVVDYSPDSSKLISAAEGSRELYVDEQFRFDHRVTTTLFVTAAEADGTPISNTRLSVYRVMTELEEWSDEYLDEAEKIAVGMTNDDGHFERTLELVDFNQKLLLELNTTRLENKALVSVSPNQTRYDFEAAQ